jgi:hypothetical protein
VETFLQKFGHRIKGVLTGFDRLVFKGLLRPIAFAAGAQSFLAMRGVLNKDYKEWMLGQTAELVQAVDRHARVACGRGIVSIASSHTRKEELAHARQKEIGIAAGLIGVWSCTEAGLSYRAAFDRERGFPQLRTDATRCRHLYFYYDHPAYGFMSVRLQTWFPYPIQIAVNGREWLRRGLDAAGISYLKHGNKFRNYSGGQSGRSSRGMGVPPMPQGLRRSPTPQGDHAVGVQSGKGGHGDVRGAFDAHCMASLWRRAAGAALAAWARRPCHGSFEPE